MTIRNASATAQNAAPCLRATTVGTGYASSIGPGSSPSPPPDRIPEIRSPSPWWHAGGMVVRVQARRLLGRQREREVLERQLGTARSGHGSVLVVHGEPGIGKTALLEYAVEAGQDFRVVRTAGVEGEMKLDYAALQQLCAPLLELGKGLPDPQRAALCVAFGLSAGQPPSP